MKGKVKWFADKKGYGFIEKEDGSGDVFVHHSGIQAQGFRSLKENQKVEFEIESTEKGDRAVKVRSLE